MKQYDVTIYEKIMHNFSIEAESPDEAVTKGYDLLANGKTETLNEFDYEQDGEYLGVEEVYEIIKLGERA